MQDIHIIGIAGRKFVGKDTAGSYFIETHGFERIAFADPIKKIAEECFGFTNEQLYGNEKETIDSYWNIAPRKVFQFFGSLCRNHIHELLPNMDKDFWISVLKKKIMDSLKKDPNSKFVITDIRYPNELAAIKEIGGITIKIKRQSVEISNDSHESEAYIDQLETDLVINNNGTKEELFTELREKVSQFRSLQSHKP